MDDAAVFHFPRQILKLPSSQYGYSPERIIREVIETAEETSDSGENTKPQAESGFELVAQYKTAFICVLCHFIRACRTCILHIIGESVK